MSIPQFSIATPTRNALHHLRRCVGSVRGQDPVPYEHLVQDAASDDGSAAWLLAQAKTDSRLRPVSERDGGMYDAINRAWARSEGELLSWLNADEQYLPGTLAFVRSYFESHPQTDALFGDYVVTDPDGQPFALRREIPLRRWLVANTFLNAQSCTLFFRRRVLLLGRLTLDTRLRYAADKALLLQLLEQGACIDHVPRVLSTFGIDGQNLSTHPAMQDEVERIRLQYGAYRIKAFRRIPRFVRHCERLLRGGYRAVDVEFDYALDETPVYRHVRVAGVGGRYHLGQGRPGTAGQGG